jgi:hypothetical protein
MMHAEEWWKHPENFALYILTGQDAESRLEDDLDQFLTGSDEKVAIEKMWFDSYDCSIELCFDAGFQLDAEALRQKLTEYGFRYGWFNFSDGSEQHFDQNKAYERRKVHGARWTEERRDKHNSR